MQIYSDIFDIRIYGYGLKYMYIDLPASTRIVSGVLCLYRTKLFFDSKKLMIGSDILTKFRRIQRVQNEILIASYSLISEESVSFKRINVSWFVSFSVSEPEGDMAQMAIW